MPPDPTPEPVAPVVQAPKVPPLDTLLEELNGHQADRENLTGARKAWATTRYRNVRAELAYHYPDAEQQLIDREAAAEAEQQAQRDAEAPLRRKEAARKASATLKARREAAKQAEEEKTEA